MDTNKTTSHQVSIETLPAMRVACYQKVSHEPETEGREFLTGWLARQKVTGPVRHFGFDIDVTAEQKNSGLRGYEVWSTVPEGVRPSEGVTIKDFPGGLYATILLVRFSVDPYAIIPPGWKELHEWVISNDNYRGGNHQWMEEIIFYPDGADLKLCYPVSPVGANGKK